MKECIEPGCDEHLKSTSGLTGGDAYKLRRYSEKGKSLTGSFLSGALYRALAVSELNASMVRTSFFHLHGNKCSRKDAAASGSRGSYDTAHGSV